MNTRRLQSVILFLSFVYFCCKEGASCKRLRKFKLSFMRLCLELIWNCVLRRNLISYCQLIFLCSYMRPCFTCMDAFRQPICCCASSCLRHLLACVSLVPSPIVVPFNTCHVVSFFSFGVFYYIWYIYLWQRHGAIDFQFSQVYHAPIHFSVWPDLPAPLEARLCTLRQKITNKSTMQPYIFWLHLTDILHPCNCS